MSTEAKRRLLWTGIMILCVFLISANWLNPGSSSSTTEPTYMTLPEPPVLDRNDPNLDSPFNFNDSYVGVLKSVWNDCLNINATNITSNQQAFAFITTADVEDIISVTLSRQSLKLDVNKAFVAVVPAQNMKDPYKTKLTNYTGHKLVPFEQQDDGTWVSQFMIGYSNEIPSAVYLMLCYDGTIEAFTEIRITANHQHSQLYYQWLTPEEPVNTFTITTGDTITTYCYYPQRQKTLADWLNSDMNYAYFQTAHGLLLDKDVLWYADMDTKTPLSNHLNIDMTHIAETLPVDKHVFDTTNSRYYTTWMGRSQNDIKQHFGEPVSTNTFAGMTQLMYAECHFLLRDDKVIQLDIQPNTKEIVNGLPHITCTGAQLTQQLRKAVIEYSDYRNTGDFDGNYHAHALSIKVGEYTVSYVWEDAMQFNPEFKEFTRIVIHTGEEYIY